jgi:hypothetical protein
MTQVLYAHMNNKTIKKKNHWDIKMFSDIKIKQYKNVFKKKTLLIKDKVRRSTSNINQFTFNTD